MPSILVKTVGLVLLALVGSFLFGLLNDLDVFKPLPAPSLGGEGRRGSITTTTPPGFVCRTLVRDTVIGKNRRMEGVGRGVGWVRLCPRVVSLGGEGRRGAITTTTPLGFVCRTLARDTIIRKKRMRDWKERK
jgi:hypothetical protein